MRDVARKLDPRQAAGPRILAALVIGLSVAACSDSAGGTDPSPLPTTPGSSLFIADQFTASQRAVRAVVDAGTVWLLDANGDFVFDPNPAASTARTNWNAQTGLALTWRQMPGAVRYHVMARNTVTAPTAWQELLVVAAPDPNLDPTVVATGVNPWTAGLGTGGFPWSFGNHVQFAIASEDAQKVMSNVSDPLDTADDFPGLLTSIAIDDAALPVPFDVRTERGATFVKTVRLSFSEPISTTAPPTLTSQSTNVTIRDIKATAWGDSGAAPSVNPPSAAANAFLRMTLTVKGACSELLVRRSAGDLILQVRDTSFFVGATRLLFLDGSTGAFLGEAIGLAAVDATLSRLTLGAALVPDLPPGALVCALSGGGATVTQFGSSTGNRVMVEDATPFFVGEQVVIYQPQTGGAGQICDLRTVAGVDTVATPNVLLLSEAPTDGHDTASVVLPLNGLGGEVSLRPSAPLVLQSDASGGPDTTELFVAGTANVMVGDTVLVDADGDLATTPDQAQATVKQVKFAPVGGTPSYSIVIDRSLTLLHGLAKVIGMGDSFKVGGTRDTSAAAVTALDPHRDQFSADGLLY